VRDSVFPAPHAVGLRARAPIARFERSRGRSHSQLHYHDAADAIHASNAPPRKGGFAHTFSSFSLTRVPFNAQTKYKQCTLFWKYFSPSSCTCAHAHICTPIIRLEVSCRLRANLYGLACEDEESVGKSPETRRSLCLGPCGSLGRIPLASAPIGGWSPPVGGPWPRTKPFPRLGKGANVERCNSTTTIILLFRRGQELTFRWLKTQVQVVVSHLLALAG